MIIAGLALFGWVGCGDPSPCDFPHTASALSGVLTNADSCGYFSVAVQDHLYIDLHVLTELPECLVALGDGLNEPNDAIYTNLEAEGPKYTFDIVAESTAGARPIDITCDEGTEWHARVDVTR